MSPELAVIILFAMLIILMASGLPVAFCMGGGSLLLGYFVIGPGILGVAASSMFSLINNFGFLALPLFILMAAVLERSGVADELYNVMYKWLGNLPGGLAIGSVIICTIFAAMSGVSAAGIVTMGLIALPAMRKRGYDKNIMIGSITASGGLGQLIPPSSMMIVWALTAGESIGQMFMGGIVPGIILSILYMAYIAIKCSIKPELGPPIPSDERVNWKEKFLALKGIILPFLLITSILASIFAGIATPTESAAVGALGSIICAIVYRRFSWASFVQSLYTTVKVVCMVSWAVCGGSTFGSIFSAVGGQQVIMSTLLGMEVNRWVILIGIQVIYLLLGCLMDPWSIMILSIPIFVPLMKSLGFDTLWFGVLFIMNMELGFLTPPMGPNLFYMKGIAPKDITMVDIYRSIVPFLGLQAIGMAICMIFPSTILFLASKVG